MPYVSRRKAHPGETIRGDRQRLRVRSEQVYTRRQPRQQKRIHQPRQRETDPNYIPGIPRRVQINIKSVEASDLGETKENRRKNKEVEGEISTSYTCWKAINLVDGLDLGRWRDLGEDERRATLIDPTCYG